MLLTVDGSAKMLEFSSQPADLCLGHGFAFVPHRFFLCSSFGCQLWFSLDVFSINLFKNAFTDQIKRDFSPPQMFVRI